MSNRKVLIEADAPAWFDSRCAVEVRITNPDGHTRVNYGRIVQPAPWLAGVKEALAEGDGFWRGCTGCHELNEGHDTGPYSDIFGCHIGAGCSECGGIGAVWDTTDYQALANAQIETLSAQREQPHIDADQLSLDGAGGVTRRRTEAEREQPQELIKLCPANAARVRELSSERKFRELPQGVVVPRELALRIETLLTCSAFEMPDTNSLASTLADQLRALLSAEGR